MSGASWSSHMGVPGITQHPVVYLHIFFLIIVIIPLLVWILVVQRLFIDIVLLDQWNPLCPGQIHKSLGTIKLIVLGWRHAARGNIWEILPFPECFWW